MRAETELPIAADTRSRSSKRALWVALVLTAATACVTGGITPVEHLDAGWYIMMAQGRVAEVISPFTARFLVPLIVRGMVATGWVSLPLAFGLIALVSCLVLSWTLARFHDEQLGRPWLAAVALLTPTALISYRSGYGPEIAHAAGVGVFFLLLKHRRWTWALLLIPLLFFIREATLLLTAVTCLVAWRHGHRRFAVAAAAVTLVAMVVGSRVVAAGRPNMHEVNPLVYMAAKLPFNALKNVLGVSLGTNTFEASFGRHLSWSVELPRWLPSGAIHRVGLEDFRVSYPLITLTSWLTAFGALPTVAWRLRHPRVRSRHDGAASRGADLWLDVAAIYSLISLLLAPALGAAVPRIVGYAWPLFWLATPARLLLRCRPDRGTGLRLLACHFALAWMLPLVPAALNPWPGDALGLPEVPAQVFTLLIALALHVRVWRMLDRISCDDLATPDNRAADNPAAARVT